MPPVPPRLRKFKQIIIIITTDISYHIAFWSYFYIVFFLKIVMIYECPSGHICFSKDDLTVYAMKGCIKQTVVISSINIDWFYKIDLLHN